MNTHFSAVRRPLIIGVVLAVLPWIARCENSIASPAASTNAAPVSSPSPSVVTVHYHRADGNYHDAYLWTWDAQPKRSRAQPPIKAGSDKFGVRFLINLAKFGKSNRIGLMPRLGTDARHIDTPPRFWTPSLGNEIWIIGGDEHVYNQAPDVSPQVVSAFADSPTQVVVRFNAPARGGAKANLVTDTGVTIPVTSAEPVKSTSDGASLELLVTTGQPLDLEKLHYHIGIEGYRDTAAVMPRGILDDPNLYFDPNAQLGVVTTSTSSTFKIFVPMATGVDLVLYDEATGSKGRAVTPLAKAGKGIWSATVPGDLHGRFYNYALHGDGYDPAKEIIDPYATNTVASTTRARITDLGPPLPPGPTFTSNTDMVICEMGVRDFSEDPNSGATNRGHYLGFTQSGTHLPDDAKIATTIDHLVEMGVTHVQLQPIQDFKNDEVVAAYNWGYIPSAYFSPEGMYASNPNDDSRVKEFRAVVTALHARGISVIMDVVYNHTSDDAPFFALSPTYYYRHYPDGRMGNGSRCGNELRTEAPMVRKLILDSLKFWVKQYGIDGFRFDLMALMDQETVHDIGKELTEVHPGIVLYGEPWWAGSPLTDETDKTALPHMEPVGAFNDDYRNMLHGHPSGPLTGWIQDGSNRAKLEKAMLVSTWLANPTQSINYMACHDDLVLWDKLKLTMPGAEDDLIKETEKLGYLVLFTTQGVPFFQGGEEFGRTKGGDSNSYVSPDTVNQVDWSLKKKNLDLCNYVRDLIALRKAHPVFRLRTRDEVVKRLHFIDDPTVTTLAYTLDGTGVPNEPWKQVFVAANSNNTDPVTVPLPPGDWFVALDEKGASTGKVPVSKTITVRFKSGVVLYQK